MLSDIEIRNACGDQTFETNRVGVSAIIPVMHAWLRYGFLGLTTVVAAARWVPPTADVPAYYLTVPHGAEHVPILSEAQRKGPFFSHDYQVKAYEMAARVEAALYQQPCYCGCDQALHHRSLHSCFEGTHGAVCATCMRQAVYTYQQTQLGKTPEQIRAGIMRGEWKDVDVLNASL